MPDYRRYYIEGGTYFFTVVTHMRRPLLNNESTIDLLEQCLNNTMGIYPFYIVVAPGSHIKKPAVIAGPVYIH